MTPLPSALGLDAHDENRCDAAGAREALERAVTWQMRAIADGLMADALLRGQKLAANVWWQQFLSRQDLIEAYLPDLKLPAFQNFRSLLAQRIATGEVQPIAADQLGTTPVQIYGGSCPFADEGRINRQLAALGSSHRLLVVGSARSRAARAAAFLGKGTELPSVLDGRFIFGEIGAVSEECGAALFSFALEFALSPAMEPEASGFQDEARIVVRAVAVKERVERDIQLRASGRPTDDHWSVATQGEDPTMDAETLFQRRMFRILAHECGHVLHMKELIAPAEGPARISRSIIRDDVLRYAIVPRALEEFHQALRRRILLDPEQQGAAQDREIENAVREFCDCGLLAKSSGGRYHCVAFERGQPWSL